MAKNTGSQNEVKVPKNLQDLHQVEHDSYDEYIFQNVAESAPKIGSLAGRSDDAFALTSDVYASFYKLSPKIVESETPSVSRKLIETMHGLPEFQDVRACTKLDDIASAIAASRFAPEMVEKLVQVEREMEKRRDENPKDYKDKGDDHIDEDVLSQARQAFRVSLEKADEEASQWGQAMAAWGIKPGELQKTPTDEKIRLAEQLVRSGSVKGVSDLAGKLKNLALGIEATIPTHGYDEVVDTARGDDIARLLPSELIKLKTQKSLFFKDYSERALGIYNMKGVEKLAKGPMVVCVDVSGSMSGIRDQWAKAVVLALSQVAERQKRAYSVITFAERVYDQWTCPKGENFSLATKMEIASVATDGAGTVFESPLTRSMDFIAESNGEFRPADIVFITDGLSEVSPAWLKKFNEARTRYGVRVIAVDVSGSVPTDCLKKFSDVVFSMGMDADEVLSLARGVFTGVIKR